MKQNNKQQTENKLLEETLKEIEKKFALLKYMGLKVVGKQLLHYMQLLKFKNQEELQLLLMLNIQLIQFMLRI